MGPSAASTRRMTPLTIFRIRSTSPPKSAWPGVSTMLIFTSPYWMAVFLARMVMPRSRSRSPESITRSWTSWLARKAPPCFSISSTRVVLPWSTWAMMATLRKCSFCIVYSSSLGKTTGAPHSGARQVARTNNFRRKFLAQGGIHFRRASPIHSGVPPQGKALWGRHSA